MSRQSTAKRRVFSASSVLDEIANDLRQIKNDDALTYADIGAILGKSEDQAAKYCAGEADMGVVSYARGKREWNGRFTGSLDRLCEETRPGNVNDHCTLSVILDCAARLSKALEDGTIDCEEVRKSRSHLEAARDAIDAQLRKLGPSTKAGGRA